MTKKKKRSAISWVVEFAGQKKPNYILSVLLAMCKVVFGLMPYLYMADIVRKLLEMHAGTLEKDMSLLTASIIGMAVFWLLCRICHAISTTLSHAATFEVLANIRRQLTEKLSKLPLGSILSQSSGTYKNIICERVDSIETTLAHIIPEVLSSAFVPVALIIYMMTINWKLTLISCICVPVGVGFFMLMINGSMSLLYCIMMTVSSFMIYESLDVMAGFSALIRSVSICVDQANEILSIPEMDIEGADITPASHDIELKHITFAYENRSIIYGVDLKIPEHTTTAIVGPSGGGKTTLTSLMARFWDVNSGEVLLGGRNVKDYSFDSLMQNFSFVFQRVYLFEDTIANNIRFGEPDAPMEKVIEAAKKARCHDFIMSLPDGYDTVIGEGGANLSGGEKQRISIARAIMKDSPIIILDEATANVDPENEAELTKAIEELTKKVLCLL